MTLNELRALVCVSYAAIAALLWLLLPGDWRGLAALPAVCCWATWIALGQRRRGAHEFIAELDQADEPDDQADEPGDREPWPPSEADDPVSYYAMLARRYAGSEQWEQRGPDDTGPHLLTAPGPAGVLQPMRGPVPNPGGPAAADSDTGEAGPPAERLARSDEHIHNGSCAPSRCWDVPPELDHAAEPDDQADELDWPDPYDLAAATLLQHARAEFDLLRRMWL